jgi:hypothetical protein
MDERTVASRRVNHAPPGILVKAELRNSPSSVTNGIQTARTRSQCSFHTTMAMSETIVVVIKVTKMTHVPYALPSLVVYAASDWEDTKGYCPHYCRQQ